MPCAAAAFSSSLIIRFCKSGGALKTEGLERTAHRHLGRESALAARRIRNPRHVHMRRSVLLVEMDGDLEPLDCSISL